MQGTVTRKLSARQMELLFAQLTRPDSAALNLGALFAIDKAFDRDVVQRAVARAATRHDALRTRLGRDDAGQYVALVDSTGTGTAGVDVINVTDEAEAFLRVTAIQDEPFHENGGLLYRWSAIVTVTGRWFLLITAHHILVDGWSLCQLIEEVAADTLGTVHYELKESSWEVIAQAELRYETGTNYTADVAFWKSETHLASPSPLKTISREAQHRFTRVPLWQAKEDFDVLAGEGGNPIHAVVERVYQLLCMAHGSDTATIAFSTLNRSAPALRDTVGYAAGTVLIGQMREGGREERIEALGRTMRRLYRHHRLPFGAMLQAVGRGGDAVPADAAVTIVLRGGKGVMIDGVLHRAEQAFGSHASIPLQIYVDMEATPDRVLYNLLFDRHYFSPALIKWFTDALLDGPATEFDGNPQASSENTNNLIGGIAATAHDHPDRIAIECGEYRLTYRELMARVASLQPSIAYHARHGAAVGVLMEPSIDRVVALLAILVAGRSYLGLDHHQPQARLRTMVVRANADAILTDTTCLASAAALGCTAFLPPPHADAAESTAWVDPAWAPDDAAYVIFTSGSTGEPKGVVTTHRGLESLRMVLQTDFAIRPESRVLHFARTSFDASIFEIVAAFANGATLIIPQPADIMYGPSLADFIARQKVSFATLPPSVAASMGEAELPCLETLVVAGEACSAELAGRWSARSRFINAYGPTEAAVCATAHLHRGTSAPPLGLPVRGASVYLLDEKLRKVEIRGVEGEIYIAGTGLARGYAGLGGLTASSFIANPFGPPGSRMYKTGDRAIFDEHGLLQFVGRCDRQFKLRGHRIEAGEIESRLLAMQGIIEAVVDCMGAGDNARLVAFLVAPSAPADGTILQAMAETLPGYMLPSRIVRLDAMPLTAHGKIDRARLADIVHTADTTPAADNVVTTVPHATPETEEAMIEAVWRELLGGASINYTKTFFEAGGNSLLLVRMIEMVNARIGTSLSIADVLSASSISALARKIRKDRGGRAGWQAKLQSLVKRERQGETL